MDDNEAAVKHFERAATVARREGDENAATYKVNLGVALYTGTGCAKDADAAAALWREAHENGVCAGVMPLPKYAKWRVTLVVTKSAPRDEDQGDRNDYVSIRIGETRRQGPLQIGSSP